MLKKTLIYIAAIVGLALYCLPIISYDVPRTDSGVFLYLGQLILDGGVPYLDVFDHKGPLLYFINAFGIFIAGGHLWGIGIIEIIFICSSVFLSYAILKRLFSGVAAIFGTAMWLAGLPLIMNGGNYCEEYGILFQFLGLYCGLKILDHKLPKYFFIFGLTLGAVISLRPNLIGMHLAVIMYLFYWFGAQKKWKNIPGISLYIALGVICVVIPFVFYFFIRGALFEMWDQLFVFNSAYSAGSATLRFRNFINMVNFNFYYGLPVLSVISILLFIRLLIKKQFPDSVIAPLAIAVTGLFLTAALILLSIRSDVNYYLSLLPPYSILAGYIAHQVLISKFKLKYFYMIFIFIICGLLPFRQWFGCLNKNYIAKMEPLTSVISYIENHTKKQDPILLWGAETRINLVTGRKSPTKYVYQWPLYRVGYVNDSHVERFLSDIREKKPVLIIDTKNGNFPSLNDKKRERWLKNYKSPYHQMPEGMNRVIGYIKGHYQLTDSTVYKDWDVYRRNESITDQ